METALNYAFDAGTDCWEMNQTFLTDADKNNCNCKYVIYYASAFPP